VQLRFVLFLEHLRHLFKHLVRIFWLLLHFFLEIFIAFVRFSSLILASSSLASVVVLYSSSSNFCFRSSFFNYLFSLSSAEFLCNSSNSIEADLTLILVNHVRSNSLGWTLETSMSDMIFWPLLLANYWQPLSTSLEDCSEHCLEHQEMIFEVQTPFNPFLLLKSLIRSR